MTLAAEIRALSERITALGPGTSILALSVRREQGGTSWAYGEMLTALNRLDGAVSALHRAARELDRKEGP